MQIEMEEEHMDFVTAGIIGAVVGGVVAAIYAIFSKKKDKE